MFVGFLLWISHLTCYKISSTGQFSKLKFAGSVHVTQLSLRHSPNLHLLPGHPADPPDNNHSGKEQRYAACQSLR